MASVSTQMVYAHALLKFIEAEAPREFANGLIGLIGCVSHDYFIVEDSGTTSHQQLEQILHDVGFGKHPDVLLGMDFNSIELQCLPKIPLDPSECTIPAKPNAGYSTKRKNKQPWKADKFGRR